MATITLEYNTRNNVANKIIDIIISLDNVFKVKNHSNSINCTKVEYEQFKTAFINNSKRSMAQQIEKYVL